MDDLTAALAGSFSVSNIPNNTAAEHPRFSQYKQKGYESSQDKRRRQILEKQKDSRYDFMKHVRRLAQNSWEDMDDEEDWEDTGEEVQTSPGGTTTFQPRVLKSKNQRRKKSGGQSDQQNQPETAPKHNKYDDQVDSFRPGRYYKDQLMMSEWMVDVPEDLSSEWLMMLCPVGKRNLVIASGGGTTSYSKGGWKVQSFPSQLPGGCKNVNGWQRDVTILDTVYSEITRTYYVLDMMCWKQMPLYDTETEFRFFWAHDKLGELGSSITTVTKTNPYRFEPLPNFSCEPANIERVLQAEMNLKLDGLLFYHKKTHYLCATTPLVLWLKAYMLPEILNIPIPANLLAEKPPQYTTFDAHKIKVKEDAEKQEQKEKERKERREQKRRSKESGRMDGVVEGESTETMDAANVS